MTITSTKLSKDTIETYPIIHLVLSILALAMNPLVIIILMILAKISVPLGIHFIYISLFFTVATLATPLIFKKFNYYTISLDISIISVVLFIFIGIWALILPITG